jgi:hypothetical protein
MGPCCLKECCTAQPHLPFTTQAKSLCAAKIEDSAKSGFWNVPLGLNQQKASFGLEKLFNLPEEGAWVWDLMNHPECQTEIGPDIG